MRPIAVTAAMLVLTAVSAAPARGSDASVTEAFPPYSSEYTLHSQLNYTAAGEEPNDVTIVSDPSAAEIVDPGAVITAGANCTSLGPNAVQCALLTAVCEYPEFCFVTSSWYRAVVTLGRGDDRFDGSTHAGCTGFEPVCLDRSQLAYTVEGGPGNDHITGGAGGPDEYDLLRGGPGDDVIVQGTGPAEIDCGSGLDTVVLSRPTPVTGCEIVL